MDVPNKQPMPDAGEHPSVLYFAAAGDDILGQNIGRGVFAGKDFQEYATIYSKSRPLAAALDAANRETRCANCYFSKEEDALSGPLLEGNKKVLSLCTGCRAFEYCDKRCQKEHWSRAHKYQCKVIKTMREQLPKYAVENVVRPVLQVTLEILIRRKHGKIPNDQWNKLLGLPSHIEKFQTKETEFEHIVRHTTASRARFPELAAYPPEFVVEFYCKVQRNALTLVSPAFDTMGIWVDDVLSQINHSCEPNVYMVMDGPRVSLRAMKPINKDEQLYISYINTSDPYTRRQQQLKESWFFTCACTKCTRGPVSDQDGWKIEPGALSPKWKRIADHILMKKKRVTEAAIDDEQRVALLEEGAFELYDAACSSASHDERLELIHKGMQFCEQSGLWPVYRQPYAALRHELNIELSTAGQLEEAWKHYSIRYWHIFPKLYTKKINPNRVVELIFGMQLVMELWERRVDLGVDMRLIGISLAQEAKMSVVLSHGEDNTFTKLVQHHYDVVRTVYDQQGHDPSMTVRRLEQERAKWQETTRKFLGAS